MSASRHELLLIIATIAVFCSMIVSSWSIANLAKGNFLCNPGSLDHVHYLRQLVACLIFGSALLAWIASSLHELPNAVFRRRIPATISILAGVSMIVMEFFARVLASIWIDYFPLQAGDTEHVGYLVAIPVAIPGLSVALVGLLSLILRRLFPRKLPALVIVIAPSVLVTVAVVLWLTSMTADRC